MSLDAAVAYVLAVLMLGGFLGGLVWLDRGPIGQRGRELRSPPPPEDELPGCELPPAGDGAQPAP